MENKNKKPMTVSEMARKGGKAVYKKYGKKGMSELGKLGMRSRWSKVKKNESNGN